MKKIYCLLAVFFIFGVAWAEDVPVTLQWEQEMSADLAGWKIYKSETPGGPYTAIIDMPYDGNELPTYEVGYTLTVSGEGGVYFVATAYDTDGNESNYSNEAVYEYDFVAPAVPVNLIFSISTP